MQPEAVPADPMAGDASEIENENSFPHFLTETEALAAEDPMAAPEEAAILPETEETAPVAEEAPAASENGEDVLAEAQIKDINGTVLLTPEEIRDALDSGALDEESIAPACLTGENGLLQWLWEFFFGKDEEETPQYSGWRTENGKTYYYDQNTHQPVTGIQSIDNKLYYFDASGVQQPATFGIDVSKYQSSIDWDKVKTAGVEFAIIRVGYRGYGSGALVQDPKFEEHFTNARNAGLRVGIYCFSQAVNENEAREEAQACVYVLNGRQLDYPIYFDTEASGSGKSTLMNIIGCLDKPTSGTYILNGKNILDYRDKDMADVRLHEIGFVFQNFQLLPGQSALNNVILPLQYAKVPKKERKAIATAALERVGLGDRLSHKPNQLSGGQCQRVAIARAMVNNPSILLADEPTGALDSKSGEQIMELFKQLNDEGVTIVMITHEAQIAEHAKRIIHIKDGEVME